MTSRSARGTARQAGTTARLGTTAVQRRLDAASEQAGVLAKRARRGLAIQIGVTLAARDAVLSTARTASGAATRKRTLNRLERRGEKVLRRGEREVRRDAAKVADRVPSL
ncbi:MAG: hypothetical protein ACYC91_11340 [Solirubrobacteraceae bacterium]